MRWAAMALMLLPGAALAQDAPVRMLGEQWTGADGNMRLAQVMLDLGERNEPASDPSIYRRLALNWQDYPYQKGPYPAAALALEQAGTVGVRLNIADDGAVRACTVVEPAQAPSLTAHACPHIRRYMRFHPVLTRNGERRGGAIDAKLSYALRPAIYAPAAPTRSESPRTPPKPLERIDAATLGVGRGAKLPRHVGGIAAALRVEADGTVSACELRSPTYVDAVDKAACDRLFRVRFEPARDAGGQTVAATHPVSAARQ